MLEKKRIFTTARGEATDMAVICEEEAFKKPKNLIYLGRKFTVGKQHAHSGLQEVESIHFF